MGLFDFFKRKGNNKTHKPSIEPTAQGGFNLNVTDFETITHQSKVLADPKIHPDFAKEFAHLITGKPAKAGDIIELKMLNVSIKLWGKSVDISFEPDKISKNLEGFVEKINQQLNWTNENKHLFDKIIIRDLLKLKNSKWLEENQSTVTDVDFLNSIRLTSIKFLPNASFELEYDDGDTFFGHSIIVNVSTKRDIKKAIIAG